MSIEPKTELDILKIMAGLPIDTPSAITESKDEDEDEDKNKDEDDKSTDSEELEEAWANSTEHFDGEDREMEQPKGEVVDTSLRRYLGAKGEHVTVDEGHTVENMMESYKKFKGGKQLDEHKDYKSYVDPLKSKGYTIKVTEGGDGELTFKVEKDGKKVTVKEPKAGEYKVTGDEKTYSTLEAAIKSKMSDTVAESSIRELKRNAGILTETNDKTPTNVVDFTELKRNAGII